MSISTINSNIPAYSAQRSIGAASQNTADSISRLSSGNRIVRAGDDVAATATGGALRGSVTVLRQALLNTSQGTSLLQIADGALSQVSDILQRQKALATQAGSGSLSDTDRSFINQEFQALTDEINRIAKSTKFGSVSLLDGTLSGAQSMISNVQLGTNTSATTAADVFQITGAVGNNETIDVNGVTVTFTTSAVGSQDANGKVAVGAAAAQTAANLARFLNENSDSRLANLTFVATGANITANWGGGALDGAYVLDASLDTATNITLGTAADRTIAAGTSGDGLSVDRVRAVGSVSGTLFANGSTTAALAGEAIVTSTIEDNADFVGKLGQGKMGRITGTFTTADTATFQLKVGNITYTANATNIVNAAVVPLAFTGADEYGNAAGGSFTLNVGGGTVATFGSQGQLDPLLAQFNEAFSTVTFTQNRDITSFQEGASVQVDGTEIANLNGASVNFRSDDFSSVNIEDIQIEQPQIGSTDARITVQVNGETYVSFSGIGNQIGINTSITLQNISNPNRALTIQTGNTAVAGSTTTAFDITNQENADALETALKKAFGIDAGSAKLSFRVGNATGETLGVKIDSVTTQNIYGGKTLSIATQAGASAASDVLDVAINRVTAIRSGVGALQSRFDFASNNIQFSVQNQDSARSALLDTDISKESTDYANAQVQVQAGVSVLAQANQLTQNLLKLIG
ncbi:MAG: flagellin [Rickettsiales bacterium]